MSITVDDIISQLKATAKSADEEGRKKIVDGLRDIAISLETQQDTNQRVAYSQFLLVAVRVACDLGLFRTLVESSNSLTVKELAAKHGTDESLMSRLCRFMSSQRLIAETGEDAFTANNVTKTFMVKGFEGAVYHYFDFIGPALFALPDFLKERKYKDLDSPVDTPFQKAFKTDQPFFLAYPEYPELFGHFNNFMKDQRLGMPTWMNSYPWKIKAAELKPEQVFFVDVGGGIGHMSVALREALPDLPNRIVVQDVSEINKSAIEHPGVEFQVHDFFTSQKIKGAKIYYMRNIMHDYPDKSCAVILEHLRDAMSPGSVILIDDMVLPPRGAHWQAMQIDMTMMTVLGARERREKEWKATISGAGLKINKIYEYTKSLNDAIIEVIPA